KMSTASPARIFVVDDDESVRRGLARLLRSHDYEVETFGAAAEFLLQGAAGSAASAPGCILIDLRMPGMDGLQLQRAIQAAGYSQPIIFISGNTDVPSTGQAMKAGALDFLTKPFDERQLLDAVEAALARDRELRAKQAVRDRARELLEILTPRERQVAELVARGMLNKQIAFELGTTESTVKVHRGRAMEKLNVDSVAELVRLLDSIGA